MMVMAGWRVVAGFQEIAVYVRKLRPIMKQKVLVISGKDGGVEE
jgi:hypothetical protein